MLTREENEMLTHVGPGTPVGALLRRYWHPFALARNLAENPIRRVRLLGEDLVLYRGESERYGLVAEQCSHRGASLAYGRIEGCTIRCRYHGWLFDPEGHCLEQPAEPPGSTFTDRVRHPAYPVQRLAGLLYAYLGPLPAPLLPHYDVLVRTDGIRKILIPPRLDCNWLQPMENSVDPSHTTYLHSGGTGRPTHGERNQEREITTFEFEVFEYGIMKKRFVANGRGELELVNAHPLVFPNMLRQHHGREHYIQYRVPMDDTHTLFYQVYFFASEDGRTVEQPEDPPVEYAPPHKTPEGVYKMDEVYMQDYMAWETAGPIYDRTQEHLGTTDKGIILFRKLLGEEMRKVQRGEDPLGVVRDPEKNRIITFATVTDKEYGNRNLWQKYSDSVSRA